MIIFEKCVSEENTVGKQILCIYNMAVSPHVSPGDPHAFIAQW